MSAIEIVAGVLLIISSILIIVLVTIQMPKGSGISSAIMGGDAAAGPVRGRARSNEEKLARMTRILAIVFFAVTLIVNLVVLIAK